MLGTRKVDDLVKSTEVKGGSKSKAVQILQVLDQGVAAFSIWTLETVCIPTRGLIPFK